jgi:hypothetical protein
VIDLIDLIDLFDSMDRPDHAATVRHAEPPAEMRRPIGRTPGSGDRVTAIDPFRQTAQHAAQ